MAVRIRLKKLGRRHRPFFRVCAMDARTPRDGRVIEELGYYDPMVRESDARAMLKGERIDYWLSVGAQPSDKVRTLIKKYGTNGTHVQQQKAAIERLASSKPTPPPPVVVPREQEEAPPAAGEDVAEENGSVAAEAEQVSDQAGEAVEETAEETAGKSGE